MSRKYKIRNQQGVYSVTFTVIQWIDVFIRSQYRDIFLDSIKFCQNKKGLQVYAYCIMSSHVHMIMGTIGKNNLEDIIRDLKKYTASMIIRAIRLNPGESRRNWLLSMFELAGSMNNNNTRFQFWQQHNHPVELDTNKMLTQRLEYIHNNPVKAGIVTIPENYLYSSASVYAGYPASFIDVLIIEE